MLYAVKKSLKKIICNRMFHNTKQNNEFKKYFHPNVSLALLPNICVDHVNTQFLEGLSIANVEKISNNVTAIKIPNFDSGFNYTPNVLYFMDYYPKLFASIKSNDKSILLGNPGVKKSTFQLVCLAIYCNPTLLGTLFVISFSV